VGVLAQGLDIGQCRRVEDAIALGLLGPELIDHHHVLGDAVLAVRNGDSELDDLLAHIRLLLLQEGRCPHHRQVLGVGHTQIVERVVVDLVQSRPGDRQLVHFLADGGDPVGDALNVSDARGPGGKQVGPATPSAA